MPDSERLVFADTSPLLYLHYARKLPLLRALYGTVVVLLVLTFSLNLLAVIIRSRSRKALRA